MMIVLTPFFIGFVVGAASVIPQNLLPYLTQSNDLNINLFNLTFPVTRGGDSGLS